MPWTPVSSEAMDGGAQTPLDDGSQTSLDDGDFQYRLDVMEDLLETRKTFIGTDLPLADLDNIISDKLYTLLNVEQSNLAMDAVSALSKLGRIHSEMVIQRFETVNVQQLIESVIQYMRTQKGIKQTVWGKIAFTSPSIDPPSVCSTA